MPVGARRSSVESLPWAVLPSFLENGRVYFPAAYQEAGKNRVQNFLTKKCERSIETGLLWRTQRLLWTDPEKVIGIIF